MTHPTAHLHVRVPCPQCGREMPTGQLQRHQQGTQCRAADVPPKLAVLACLECDEVIPLMGVPYPFGRLERHCREVHGRRPSLLERTPARREQAA